MQNTSSYVAKTSDLSTSGIWVGQTIPSLVTNSYLIYEHTLLWNWISYVGGKQKSATLRVRSRSQGHRWVRWPYDNI